MYLKRIVPLLFLGWAAAAGAQTASPNARALSLAECIQIALEHNLDVKIERYSPEMARYAVSLSYGAYDPEFSASASHSSTLSPGGIDSQSRPYQGSETETDSFTTGLRGLLPVGMSYNLSLTTSDQHGTRPDFRPDLSLPVVRTTYLTNINDPNDIFAVTSTNYPSTILSRSPFESSFARGAILDVRQPLLKNFWIDGTRYNIYIAKNRLKQSEMALRLRIMTTVEAVQTAYYSLIQARENVKNQEKALELAKRLLSENKKRVEVGALAPLDEKQAQSQVAQRQADLLATQNNLYMQQNALKKLMSDDFTAWNTVTVEPTDPLTANVQLFDVQESWQKGLSKRPDLLQMRLDLERQGIQLRYEKNQLFPQLDLIGSYGWLGSGAEFTDALGTVNRGSNPYYSYGAELRVPLGNRIARQNYKITKAERQQMLLRLKKLEQDIMVEIDNAVKQAQTAYESVKATRDAEAYAGEALRAEEKKLENGKSTSFFVLQLQRDLTFARTAAIAALADYNQSLAALAFSEATTLERNNLSVDIK